MEEKAYFWVSTEVIGQGECYNGDLFLYSFSSALRHYHLLKSLNENIGHTLIAYVVGMEGDVDGLHGKVVLTAALSKPVSNGEALIFGNLTNEVGVFPQVNLRTVGCNHRVVPMGRQVVAEAIGLARRAKHHLGTFVDLEDTVDDAAILVGKCGIVLLSDVIVFEATHFDAMPPVVDAMLDGVVIGAYYGIVGRAERAGVDTAIEELLEVEFVHYAILIAARKGASSKRDIIVIPCDGSAKTAPAAIHLYRSRADVAFGKERGVAERDAIYRRDVIDRRLVGAFMDYHALCERA